ncbi:glycosyltransferase 28 domain protein [Calothrix sp. NIES-4071]|nr:glycosyltransferase 28 domain protein [Calothrix sp. NIES-4071]BAZ55871.1 glycosyltransferase 28 domain protein [Calothrix sp. NIES-4105]
MITVTLGTIPFPFKRVIDWLSILLDCEVISEPIFIQHGATDISAIAEHPLVTAVPLLDFESLMKKAQDSRLVISHAGQGSTRAFVEKGASLILLPRLARYGEHIDNHQMLFAKSVQELGVSVCLSLYELKQTVLQPPPYMQKQLFAGPKLSEYLSQKYPVELVKC